MVTITDVSPNRSNMSFGPNWQDVTGRMLSLASSDDGKLVFAGSLSSGLWVSEDGGESWVQLAWEQPAPDQFGVPGALGGCCIPSVAVGPESARWSVERNPRFLADITGDGRADIVGFGDTGVWTALSNGDGTFQPPRVVLADFCLQAGGWRVDRHPRFLADITGDGRADIVGFGDAGVWTALSNGDGTFQAPQFVLADLGFEAGGWRVDKHPRFLADITGDGRADIVGFGDAGVWTALSNGDGTFQAPQFVLADLGFEAGGWRVEKHPALPRRHHRRRPGRHRRLRRRRRVDGAEQRRRHVPGAAVRAWPTSASRPAAGGWTGTPASWPTSPATAGPTSSASATPACGRR